MSVATHKSNMKRIRRSEERGYADHGWLKSHHTFSFSGYYDPKHMGFRNLRVINEDQVEPARGFGTHGHDNMEIISYVLAGELEHKDSMGNGETLTPGEFQLISAGSGITHSEFNPSNQDRVHFYQIWLEPNIRDTEPAYQQKDFSEAEKHNHFRLVASPEGRDGSLQVKQDAEIYLSKLANYSTTFSLKEKRSLWVQVLSGALQIEGESLMAGDAIAFEGDQTARKIEFMTDSESEVLIFDLP